MDTKQTPWFVLHSPEIGKAFREFAAICDEDGVLEEKTRALLMMALASAFHCAPRTEVHLRAALEAGATKGEINEVVLIAVLENAQAQLAWMKDICCRGLDGSCGDKT